MWREVSFPKSWEMHGVLLYDTKREEGKVRLFPTLPDGVMGADILLDWIHDLKEQYNERVKGL